MAARCSGSDFICIESTGQVALLAAITGAGGAALGALVGAFIHDEDWVAAGDDPGLGLLLGPSENGTTVGLSIRF
jgi:hypothetical protein